MALISQFSIHFNSFQFISIHLKFCLIYSISFEGKVGSLCFQVLNKVQTIILLTCNVEYISTEL